MNALLEGAHTAGDVRRRAHRQLHGLDHQPIFLEHQDLEVAIDLQRLVDVGAIEELLGEQVVDDHLGVPLVDRPRNHRSDAVDAPEERQVGSAERRARKAVIAVLEPRHLAEQRLSARGRRTGLVEERQAAAIACLDHVGFEFETGAEAPGVQNPDVVEVHQVLVDELPVAREVDLDLVAETALLPAQERELFVDRGHRIGQRFGVVVKVDEDVAPPHVDLHWRQGTIGEVESLGVLHVGSTLQLAIESVHPTVVRAAEGLLVA